MNSIEVIQGNQVDINIKPYLVSRGWTVEGKFLRHSSENSGEAVFYKYNIIPERKYVVSFIITNRTSGIVRVSLGGSIPHEVSSNGYHQFTITSVDDSKLSFYSDGDLSVSEIGIISSPTTDVQIYGDKTVAYSENKRGWVSFRSYEPESGVSIKSEMITFKNGDMWIHNDLLNPNSFYGVQHNSTIKFQVSSLNVKTYNSIAVHSNKVVGTTEEGIVTELGDITDLVVYDFNTKEGIHYANLLKDELTNNLPQGRYIVIELTDEESKTEKLQIFKVVIKSTISTVNE